MRQAQPADAPDLARISSASLSDSWSQRDFRDTMGQAQGLVLVAEREGKPLGYVVFYFAADEGEIPSIAVSPENRRKGIADALLQSLFTEADRRGVSRIFLEVRASNVPAHRLYEKNGFLKAGTRRNFYENPKEDADLLVCQVSDGVRRRFGYAGYMFAGDGRDDAFAQTPSDIHDGEVRRE